MTVGERLSTLKEELKPYGDVCVVAATKTQPIKTVRELLALDGDIIPAENRVQELLEKYDPSIKWHFIGRLQTNKVKYIVDKVELIQSLDSLSLAKEIDRQASKHAIKAHCLIEVNVGGEQSKGGIAPDGLAEFADGLRGFDNLYIDGLMTVMPKDLPAGELAALYGRLWRLFDGAKALKGDNIDMRILSAGMSSDYKIALDNGANMLRLGTRLFGPRNYNLCEG